MVKWKKANVSHYVGLDFSDSSITEAQTRYLSLVIDQAHNRRDRFPAIFIVADAGDQQNLLTEIFQRDEKLKRLRQKIIFDVVST
jgi:hypothetical protein